MRELLQRAKEALHPRVKVLRQLCHRSQPDRTVQRVHQQGLHELCLPAPRYTTPRHVLPVLLLKLHAPLPELVQMGPCAKPMLSLC